MRFMEILVFYTYRFIDMSMVHFGPVKYQELIFKIETNKKYFLELIQSNYNFVGGHNAKGFNVNIPLNEIGMHNGDYLAIFQNIILPIAYEFNPQLVIVSAGYDAGKRLN